MTTSPRPRHDRTTTRLRATRFHRSAALSGLLAVAAVVLLVGAAPAQAAPPSADPQPPGGVPGVEVPVIAWSEAGDGYQKARIAVPSDYAHPEGPKFHLNAVRLPASDPEKRLGSIFFNFGGPGEGAAASVGEGGKSILAPEVLARYDVIGVDPRGTGRSQPVRCLSGIKAQQKLPYAMGATFPPMHASGSSPIDRHTATRGHATPEMATCSTTSARCRLRATWTSSARPWATTKSTWSDYLTAPFLRRSSRTRSPLEPAPSCWTEW